MEEVNMEVLKIPTALLKKHVNDKPLLMIFPFELLSHYLRCIDLCKPLTCRYRIIFAHSDKYNHYVQAAGYETFPYQHMDSAAIMHCAENFDFSWLNYEILHCQYKVQLCTVRRYKPAAILSDNMPTLRMVAEKTDTRLIALMNAYMSPFYARTRKLSRRHHAFKYQQKTPEKVFEVVTKLAEKAMFFKVHAPFRQIRKEQNLSWKSSYLDELQGHETWLCDLPEIFPQKALPALFNFIGPLFHRSENRPQAPNLLIDHDKKTILVMLGSTGKWQQLSFLNDPHYEQYNMLVIGDEQKVLNAGFMQHIDFTNDMELFALVDLLICHGGNGSIYKALSHRIPVLAKTSHFEQEWNMDGLAAKKLGQNLDDISNTEEYRQLIAFWVGQKGHYRFKTCAETIRQYREDFLVNAGILHGQEKQIAG